VRKIAAVRDNLEADEQNIFDMLKSRFDLGKLKSFADR
jgi:hypothetical protein